jgi:hypothetical protein
LDPGTAGAAAVAVDEFVPQCQLMGPTVSALLLELVLPGRIERSPAISVIALNTGFMICNNVIAELQPEICNLTCSAGLRCESCGPS